MRAVLHLGPRDARRVPWKNGRGVTEELAIWPAAASFERNDFDWRISKARVEVDGPFSSFEHHDRILVVTDGDGLVIGHGASAPRARIRRLEPYRFRGDWTTSAELTRGAVADFNVLTRRDAVEASVEALTLGARRTRESFGPGHAFVHVLRGRATARAVGEEEPFELGPADSLWIRDARGEEELDLAGGGPDCTLLVVRLGPARPR
jgi:environmental stress-induced protein Ves